MRGVLIITLVFSLSLSTHRSCSYADAAPQLYGYNLKLQWFDNNDRCWYRIDRRDGTCEFVVVDTKTGKREPCFDHDAVLNQIRQASDKPCDGVRHIVFSEDGSFVTLFTLEGAWRLDLASQELSPAEVGVDQLPQLKPLTRVTRSRGQGVDTFITFANKTDEKCVVQWVNVSGEPVEFFSLAAGEVKRQHTHARHVWQIVATDRTTAFRAEPYESIAIIDSRSLNRGASSGNGRGDLTVDSRDAKWTSFVQDHNLWLRKASDGSEYQLTITGNAASSFHKSAQRRRAVSLAYEQQDYPDSLPEVYWSPNSRYAIAIRTDVVPEPTLTLVESSPDDSLRPVTRSLPYLRPGDALPTQHVHLFDVENQTEIAIDDVATPNPYKLSNFYWSRDSKAFYYVYNKRGHKVIQVIGIDAATGQASIVVDEQSETFVDYAGGKLTLRHLPLSNELVWMSERSGWNHLYLYNRESREVVRPITQGEWVVKSIAHFDKRERSLWVTARGYVEGQDHSYEHLLRVGLDGEKPQQLTKGDGTHEISFSPDKRFFLDSWSRVDLPPRHCLRRSDDGKLVCDLETADDTEVRQSGFRAPERFTAMGRDGAVAIEGIIHYPGNFNPDKKYPVVENIYSSPSGQYVPKNFRWDYRHQREIADEGFVVVQIDGQGTNWRSRAYHDIGWRNLADSGFPDRIAWMKQAAETRPWMDVSRVGIYGGSAGGQNALRALIDHNDFYSVAVADCGCHDNRVDKLWWNELWMGWPVGDAYEKCSNVVHAHRMQGKLLLSVGEMDDNVDPANTYQVVNALRKADKDFDLLVFPGLGHAAIESTYGRRKRLEFFKRHLLNDNASAKTESFEEVTTQTN